MKKEDINREANLKSILKNNHGFKTPKNYFSELNDNLDTKLLEETLPKENGFVVNEDYFKNIETTIIEATSKEKNKIITLKKLNAWAAVAAILVISFCVGIFYFTNTSNKVNFDNIAKSDIEYWIDNSPLLLSSLEVESFFYDENLEETSFDFTEISSDALEEYILNENVIDEYNGI